MSVRKCSLADAPVLRATIICFGTPHMLNAEPANNLRLSFMLSCHARFSTHYQFVYLVLNYLSFSTTTSFIMANIHNTDYEGLVKDLRSEFDSRKTRSLSWRKDQLRGLIRMFDEQEELFVRALKEDLGKPRQEAILMEIQ
ncbi:Aldehyde dehydrogenase, partial [Caligus rogercresseyi]